MGTEASVVVEWSNSPLVVSLGVERVANRKSEGKKQVNDCPPAATVSCFRPSEKPSTFVPARKQQVATGACQLLANQIRASRLELDRVVSDKRETETEREKEKK